MTEVQLKEFLEENKVDIQAAIKSKMIERFTAEHRWDISEQVTKAVQAFIKAEVIPAVEAELQSQKGLIISATIKSLADISDRLAKGLALDASKRVGDEYRRKEIVKAIFGF